MTTFEEWIASLDGKAHLYVDADQAYRDALSFLTAIRGRMRGYVAVPAAVPASFFRAASSLGCKLRFYDVDDSLSPHPSSLAATLERDTVAVLVVHRFGVPQKMREIAEISRRAQTVLIEDCSFGFPSSARESAFGTIGDIAIFDLREALGAPRGGLLRVGATFDDFCPRYDRTSARSTGAVVRRVLKALYVRAVGRADPLGLVNDWGHARTSEALRGGSCVARPSRKLELYLGKGDFDGTITTCRDGFRFLRENLPAAIYHEPFHRMPSSVMIPSRFPLRIDGDLRLRFEEELAHRGIETAKGLGLAPSALRRVTKGHVFTSLLEIPLRGAGGRARLERVALALDDIARMLRTHEKRASRRAA